MKVNRLMTNNASPFKVLGIDPAFLRGMPDERAFTVVQAIGKGLQRAFHPDQGGDEKLFKAVTTALEDIQDHAVFKTHLGEFLKPRKSQLTELEKRFQAVERTARFHESRVTAFALAQTNEVLTVASRQSLQLSVLDVVRVNLHGHSLGKPDAFVTLVTDALGHMVVARGVAPAKPVPRQLIGTIPRGVNITELMRQCQPDRADLLQNGGRMKLVGRTDRVTDAAPIGSNRVPLAVAKPVLRRLQPDLTIGSYLFSIVRTESGDALYFEGSIVKVELGAGSL
jgi:hypothetical protein